MRGFPLINLLLVVALILLTSFPLVRLAQHEAGPQPAASQETRAAESDASMVTTSVSVRLVHPAQEVSLRKGEKLLHTWKPAEGTELQASIPLPLEESTMEIEVSLIWPEGTPNTVAEIKLEPENLEARTANIWGQGSTSEILTFQWITPP